MIVYKYKNDIHIPLHSIVVYELSNRSTLQWFLVIIHFCLLNSLEIKKEYVGFHTYKKINYIVRYFANL